MVEQTILHSHTQTAEGPILRSPRLILRPWREADIDPFAKLNADPVVMEYFPSTRTYQESTEAVRAFQRNMKDRGFGFWAVEVPGKADFIGFVGLNIPNFSPPFAVAQPFVEIGWRISREFWNQGYATEAARAGIEFGFGQLKLTEIVSFTVPANMRSRAVMERIGMSQTERFKHPNLPEGHRLQEHVLYRKTER